MKYTGWIVALLLAAILFSINCRHTRLQHTIGIADIILTLTDSIVDSHNSGTLDDPDSTTAAYLNLRCDYDQSKE